MELAVNIIVIFYIPHHYYVLYFSGNTTSSRSWYTSERATDATYFTAGKVSGSLEGFISIKL